MRAIVVPRAVRVTPVARFAVVPMYGTLVRVAARDVTVPRSVVFGVCVVRDNTFDVVRDVFVSDVGDVWVRDVMILVDVRGDDVDVALPRSRTVVLDFAEFDSRDVAVAPVVRSPTFFWRVVVVAGVVPRRAARAISSPVSAQTAA